MSDASSLRQALVAWRDWELAKGATEQSLPSVHVLTRITTRNPGSFDDLVRSVGRADEDVVRTHSAKIMRALGISDSGEAADRQEAPEEMPASSSTAPSAGATKAKDAEIEAQSPSPVPLEPEDEQPTLDASGFATYTFGAHEGALATATPIVQQDGSVLISWPPYESDGVVVYRAVLQTENYVSPDHGDVLAVTTSTTAVDPMDWNNVLHHVTVWVNAGADLKAAQASQPWLHAEVDIVAPARDVELRNDDGVVLGRWLVGDGASRVRVLRMDPRVAPRVGFDPSYEICTGSRNLTGMQDDSAERGRTYVYRLYVEAEGSTAMSLPISVPLEVEAQPEPVIDLQVELELRPDGEAYASLAWTAPTVGDVVIYRTENGPATGAEENVFTREQLDMESSRLPERFRVINPVAEEGDRRSMTKVTWPQGWTAATFTPVTVVGQRVRIGSSVQKLRPQALVDAHISERVDWQHLSFGWPDGAQQVRVYVKPKGQPLEEDPGDPWAWIDRDTYVKEGGLRLEGSSALPFQRLGVDLHLVPVTYHQTGLVKGSPAQIPYFGVLRYRYSLVGPGGLKGLVGSRRRTVRVTCLDFPRIPPMVVVHRPDRFPLTEDDARLIGRLEWSEPVELGQPVEVGEIDLPEGPGWVRLFLQLPANFPPVDAALLDPPVEELRCPR